MGVTRSPEFTKNVQKMRDEGYDHAETRMFACPFCGHMTVHSHRWTEPFDCLDEGCSCPGYKMDMSKPDSVMIFGTERFVDAPGDDMDELNAAFNMAWNS